MSFVAYKRNASLSSRAFLVPLLVGLLVFPPWMFADQITWIPGTGEFGTAANWNGGNVPGINDNAIILSGGGVSTVANLDLEGGLDSVTVNSMAIRGGHVSSTATLNVSGGPGSPTNITFGTPYNTTGNVLSIGNRGSLDIGSYGTATLELSGGGGSLWPNSPNSVSAYVASGGQIGVSGGGQLVLQNSAGGTRVLTNNGNIGVTGASDSTALVLNSGFLGQSIPGTYVLSGSGTISLAGTGAITGASGAETLVNGANQTINGTGSGSIFGLAAITNNGTLAAAGEKIFTESVSGTNSFSVPSTPVTPALTVASPLTNWNGVNDKLTGGNYAAVSGGVLQLSSIGGNSIQTLNLAGVTLTGGGSLITGDGTTNALAGLSTINDSNLSLAFGASLTDSPSGKNPTLTLSSNSLNIPSSLSVNYGSQLTINGTLSTSSSTYGLPTEFANSNISVDNGSTLTVDNLNASSRNTGSSTIDVSGSTLAVNNNIHQGGGYGSPVSTGNNTLSLYDSTTTVGGNFTNNSSYSANTSSYGSSTVSVNGGTLAVTNNFRQGGGFGSPLSNGNNTLNVSGGATVTVGGNFSNNSVANSSIVNVTGPGTTLGVTGTFSQWQGNNDSGGVSQLNLTNGAGMTVGNLTNSTTSLGGGQNGLNFTPQSQISITGGSALTVTNNFTNANASGVLNGGSYTLGTGSSLSYNGTDINAIGANTLVTLDNFGAGTTGTIQNLTSGNSLASMLNTVNGALTLQNGASLALTQALNISGGQVSLVGGTGANQLSANGLTNTGTILIAAGDTADFRGTSGTATFTNLTSGTLSGGGTYNVGGNLFFGAGTDGGTAINTLSGVNVSLSGAGVIGTGSGNDALAGLTGITNSSSLTLNITAAPRTFTGLTIDNTSSLTLNNSAAAFQMGGGANAPVNADNEGTINVNGGSTLTLAGATATGQAISAPGTFTNNGALNIGSTTLGSTGVATLQTNGGGSAFTIGGSGTVTLAGQGQIVVGGNDSLTVGGTLTNWDGSSLNGGGYNVGNGSALTLSSIGSGNTIQGLANGAAVTIGGSGLLSGDGTTNALAGLTSIDSTSALTLQQGANLALTSSTFTNSGAVSITSGSTLDGSALGSGFQDMGGAMNGNYLIGSSSFLKYSGNDITLIYGNLTLDNTGGTNGSNSTPNTTGQITNISNGDHDALSGSLNRVQGTLNLQNNANLTLTGAQSQFTDQGGGQVNIVNGSKLDVSALGANFQDVQSGVLTGSYLIGTNSVLNYSGSAITQISGNLTLDNTGGTQSPNTTGMITNASGDALSGSLNTVGFTGTLTLQNNANLTLTGAQSQFTNQGYVNITNGSILDVSALGGNFQDVQAGVLTGNYLIGTNSFLNYSGAGNNITQIAGSLILDNSNGGTTGMITNGGASAANDALSNSLTTIYGYLNLQNNASLTLSQSVTSNQGYVDLDQGGVGGSTLTTNHFTNYNGYLILQNNSTLQVGSSSAAHSFANISDDNNSDTYGQSYLSLGGASKATISNNLYNASNTYQGGEAYAYVNLQGQSSLTVNGNVKNVANDYSGGYSDAEIDLDGGSSLTVNGTFKNDSGNYTGYASLNLTNNSTATISGLFTNTGGSLVSLDYGSGLTEGYPGNGGSSLTANGGFTNYNSAVILANNSAMTVSGGFLNLSDDSANSQGLGQSLLVLGSFEGEGGSSQKGSEITSQIGPFGAGSIATITGGLVNSASTSNGGSAESLVVVNSGSILNVDNLTNSASVNTPGGNDYAEASVYVSGGSRLNVTGNLSNTSSQPLFYQSGNSFPFNASLGYAEASVLVSEGSTLTVGGALTNTNAYVALCSNSFLNSTGGVLNSATDTLAALYNLPGGPITVGDAEFSLSDSAAKITGGFTNSAIALLGGTSTSTLSLDNSYMRVDTLTNVATGTYGSATASVNVTDGSYLHVTGDLNNTATGGANSASAVITVDGTGTGLRVDGAFNNTSGTLNLSNGSSTTVKGLFTSDSNSVVNLDQVGNGGSTLNTSGGMSNSGAINLGSNSTLANTGTFSNSGTIAFLGTGATVSSTSDFSNAAAGVVTLGGSGDTLSVGGNLTNAGTVSIADGEQVTVGGATGYTQSGGTTTIATGGELSVTGAGATIDVQGGTMTGGGTVIGTLVIDGNVANSTQGTLNPGDPQDFYVDGTYDQTELGILTLDFDGFANPDQPVVYDQIDVTGNVELGGTLNLNLENGFDAAIGDQFDIINWTTGETGDFNTFNDVTFDNGTLTFQEVFNPNGQELDLDVVAVGTATPEPSTLSMLFCAMLLGGGITWRIRRRRANIG